MSSIFFSFEKCFFSIVFGMFEPFVYSNQLHAFHIATFAVNESQIEIVFHDSIDCTHILIYKSMILKPCHVCFLFQFNMISKKIEGIGVEMCTGVHSWKWQRQSANESSIENGFIRCFLPFLEFCRMDEERKKWTWKLITYCEQFQWL